MKVIVVIINTQAKNADAGQAYRDYFTAEQINYDFFSVYPDELEATIKNCIDKYKILLIGGGDGAIRTAAQYCANRPVTLGVLALGTMNHFAKELGLPLTPETLAQAITRPQLKKIDLGEVNGKVFVNNSSIGFYPKLAKKRDYYKHFYNKWLSYIPSFFKAFKYHKSYKILVKNKDFNFSLTTSFCMLSNNLYSYHFPLTISREIFDENKLGLYFFKQGKLQLIKLIRRFLNREASFEIMETSFPIELHFKKHSALTISLDGDTFSMETPLCYKILPRSLLLLSSKL